MLKESNRKKKKVFFGFGDVALDQCIKNSWLTELSLSEFRQFWGFSALFLLAHLEIAVINPVWR